MSHYPQSHQLRRDVPQDSNHKSSRAAENPFIDTGEKTSRHYESVRILGDIEHAMLKIEAAHQALRERLGPVTAERPARPSAGVSLAPPPYEAPLFRQIDAVLQRMKQTCDSIFELLEDVEVG